MRCARAIIGVALASLLVASGCATDELTGSPISTPPASLPVSTPDPDQSASSAEPEDESTPQSSADAEATEVAAEPSTNDQTTQAPRPPRYLSPGDDGDKVRELQHRLLQLAWYEGAISGTYDPSTEAAVDGFQNKRGMEGLGYVDQATWDTLVSMSRKPTRDEMYNVLKPGPAIMKTGSQGDDVKDLQARLKQIAWYAASIDGVYGDKTDAAVKGFQEKRAIPATGDVDQRTLDRLHAMTRTPTADELANKPKTDPENAAPTLDPRCMTGRALCISKTTRKLYWVIDGQVQKTLSVRFGSTRTPTREGAFAVTWKSKNHHSKLYDSEMPYAMFFSRGQAVHYSSDFARRGYSGASHGCVNVRDKAGIQWLFDQVREGDTVVVFR